MEDEEEEHFKGEPSKRRNNRRQTGPTPPTEEDNRPSKKMKVDDAQEVNELFQSSVKHADVIDITVKKFVFKMVSEISNSSKNSKVAIKDIWKKFFKLPDEQQINGTTGKTFMNSMEDLKKVLDQMEQEDFVMIDGEDVIMTS